MEEFTPGDVRARSFRVVMRGFDKDEVADYLWHVAEYLEAVRQQLHQAGVTEVASPQDLAAEYSAAGEEVTRVLAEARAAADAMRSRAAAETAQWRADAEDATTSARQSAWETGSEMLEEVVAQCEALLSEAQENALRLRLESERESSRMVTDAQREREELARAGRDEAEKTVTAARKEADGLLLAARQQADVAQERTRALEARRAELMDELESAQKALLGIEDDSAETEPPDETEVAGAEEPRPTRSNWPDDDAVVKIVAAKPKVQADTVDADALAAEVEAMRGRGRQRQPEPKPEPEPKTRRKPEPKIEPKLEPKPEPQSKAEPEPKPKPKPKPKPDPLSGLFDELRTPEQTVPESPNGRPEPEEDATVVVLTEKPSQAPEEARDSRPVTRDSTDPFALRDRLLLPVQNRALRLVKRRLVAAQNIALEELRLDPEWSPDPGLVDGEIAGVLVELVEESAAAGIAAAAELLGRTDATQPDVDVVDSGAEFTGSFVDAVALSLDRSRSAGAGKRETSSSLSRVFRAWRTDDAERRVRLMSRRAYHEGLLAALEAMDCDRVVIGLFDKSCVDHSDASESWLIEDGPPAGVLIPPASLECSCTVVPNC